MQMAVVLLMYMKLLVNVCTRWSHLENIQRQLFHRLQQIQNMLKLEMTQHNINNNNETQLLTHQ